MRSDPCRWPNEWPDNRAASAKPLLGPLAEADWRPRVRDARAPTLVVHGTKDAIPLAGSQEWARTLPNARPAPGRSGSPHASAGTTGPRHAGFA